MSGIEAVENRLLCKQLLSLAKLDNRDRDILLMYVNGYTYNQIAEKVGLSQFSVITRRHRLLTKLRKTAIALSPAEKYKIKKLQMANMWTEAYEMKEFLFKRRHGYV